MNIIISFVLSISFSLQVPITPHKYFKMYTDHKKFYDIKRSVGFWNN